MASGSKLTALELRAGNRRKAERPAELWSLVNRILATIIVVATLCALALWLLPEINKRDELAASLETKKQQLAEAQLQQRQYERERFLLENDVEYIETIARDRLDLMKEGETIIRLEPAPPAATASPPPTAPQAVPRHK